MDPDIPIAYGQAVPMAPPPQASAPVRDMHGARALNGGRSSRVMLPTPSSLKPRLDDDMRRTLQAQGFTNGLAEALMKNKIAFPLAIWIVDNSGSMGSMDGQRLVEMSKKNDIKMVACSRWAEMQQTVDYHIQMSALIKSPTVFRLLNDPGKVVGPQQFSVFERGDQFLSEDVATAQQTIMNAAPSGVTPLTIHLHEIRQNILDMETELRGDGTKVVLVIATDGLPSDNGGISNHTTKREFEEALRRLEGLPVWIVVRLCTDEEDVVEYWSELDSRLELSLEVIDDFKGEAEEVYEHNKWLNYGLPLHRMREMGFYSKLFDLLDEQKFTKEQLRQFFRLLFGDNKMDGVPDPQADWKGFCSSIQRLVDSEKPTWNPITKKVQPWVDMKKLKKEYGGGWAFW